MPKVARKVLVYMSIASLPLFATKSYMNLRWLSRVYM